MLWFSKKRYNWYLGIENAKIKWLKSHDNEFENCKKREESSQEALGLKETEDQVMVGDDFIGKKNRVALQLGLVCVSPANNV